MENRQIVFQGEFLASRIKLKMKVFKLSSRKAASQIGINHVTLSRIVNNKQIPDSINLYKLCYWIGLPMENFFYEK